LAGTREPHLRSSVPTELVRLAWPAPNRPQAVQEGLARLRTEALARLPADTLARLQTAAPDRPAPSESEEHSL
jgi:hypothetical protein